MTDKLKGTKTMENLAKAFAGECQAGARYRFAAEKAETDGYYAVAERLKLLSKNEMAHAKVFFDYITNNGSEKTDNIDISGGYPYKCGLLPDELSYSAENEKEESEKIYPLAAKTAKGEGFDSIATSFALIARVENNHRRQLSEIAELLKAERLYKSDKPSKWVCSNCGHSDTLTAAWAVCPLCRYPAGYTEIPVQQ